jgi:hypothetical protein
MALTAAIDCCALAVSKQALLQLPPGVTFKSRSVANGRRQRHKACPAARPCSQHTYTLLSLVPCRPPCPAMRLRCAQRQQQPVSACQLSMSPAWPSCHQNWTGQGRSWQFAHTHWQLNLQGEQSCQQTGRHHQLRLRGKLKVAANCTVHEVYMHQLCVCAPALL